MSASSALRDNSGGSCEEAFGGEKSRDSLQDDAEDFLLGLRGGGEAGGSTGAEYTLVGVARKLSGCLVEGLRRGRRGGVGGLKSSKDEAEDDGLLPHSFEGRSSSWSDGGIRSKLSRLARLIVLVFDIFPSWRLDATIVVPR